MKTTPPRGAAWKGLVSLAVTFCMVLCLFSSSAYAAQSQSYVALGDSITSGYGLSSTDSAFPALLTANNTLTLTNLSESGETAQGLLATVNANKATIGAADVITITIGGNDLMNAFYAYLADQYTAVNPSDPVDAAAVQARLAAKEPVMVNFVLMKVIECTMVEESAQALKLALSQSLSQVQTSFTALLTAIRTINPQAYLIVTTQYNPYAFAAAEAGASKMSALFDESLAQLNGALKLGSRLLDYQVADVYTAFANASQNPCNARLDMQNVANCELDFHPNAYGHQLIADTIQPLIDCRVALTPSTYAFDTQEEGYTAPAPQTFTMENVGNGALSNVTVTLSGSDKDSFQLDTSNTATALNAGASTTFAVVPVEGLTEGTYEATVSVSADAIRTRSASITFTVDPPPTYLLTVENGTGGGSFQAGAQVVITSNEPDATGHFSSWSVTSGTGGTFTDAAQAETTFTMPAEPVTVTASFAPHTPDSDDGDCTTPILCTDCGYATTPGEASHDFATYHSNGDATCDQDGTETATCARCTITDTRTEAGSALGHIYTNPVFQWADDLQSCTVTFTCTRDSQHKLTQDAQITTEVTQEPTCTEAGIHTYTAKLKYDGNLYSTSQSVMDLAPLGHDFAAYHSNGDATCTQDGTETAVCSRCDATDTRTESGTALGHSYENPVFQWSEDFQSCSVTFTCTRDSQHTTTETAQVTAVVTQEPTCTQDGVHTYTATLEFEGEEYSESQTVTDLAPLGHDFAAYHSNEDATCTQDGTETAACTRCGDTDTRTVAGSALGHDLIPHEGQAPTCTESGWAPYDTCSRCDYSSYESLAATGHDPQRRNVQEATCTSRGYTGDLYCATCGERLEKGTVTSKIAHDYKRGICTVCGAEDPDYTPGILFWTSPETGDTSMTALWIVVLVLAGAGVIGVVVYNRKQHKKR